MGKQNKTALQKRIKLYLRLYLGKVCERTIEMTDDLNELVVHPDRNDFQNDKAKKRIPFLSGLLDQQIGHMERIIEDIKRL